MKNTHGGRRLSTQYLHHTLSSRGKYLFTSNGPMPCALTPSWFQRALLTLSRLRNSQYPSSSPPYFALMISNASTGPFRSIASLNKPFGNVGPAPDQPPTITTALFIGVIEHGRSELLPQMTLGFHEPDERICCHRSLVRQRHVVPGGRHSPRPAPDQAY